MDRFRDATYMLSQFADQSFSRRALLKRSAALAVAVPVVGSLLAACDDDDDDTDDAPPADTDDDDDDEPVVDDDDDEEDEEEPDDTDDDEDDEPADTDDDDDRYGGQLNVALIGEPVHLDLHKTTTSIVALVTWHIWEPLFTYDDDFQLIPDLAESYEASDDALNHTISLRQGVLFHNGDEMTADDVVASINRWGQSGIGASMLAATESIEAVDDYTVEITMAEPYGIVNVNLSRQNQGCGIHPAEVMEEIGDDTLQDNFIGTGPFEFVERAADRYIRVQRFEDYVARDEDATGYGGRKTAYVDRIEFIPVPDESARLSGLRAGDYHYLENVAPDQLSTIEGDDGVVAEILPPESWNVFVMNWESPITSDLTTRQAMQAALNHEEIAQAAFGADFFELQPGLMHRETAWHSEVGAELYNINDPERAQELLEESAYDGQTVRLMTTQEYSYMFNGASLVQQQWEDVGIDVELDVVDWATLGDRREQPDEYDVFTTGMTFRVDPTMHAWISSCTWPGWWCSDEKEEYMRQHMETADFDERFAAFEEIQRLFYEDVGQIKIADGNALRANRVEVQGLVPFTQLRPLFWNVWLED